MVGDSPGNIRHAKQTSISFTIADELTADSAIDPVAEALSRHRANTKAEMTAMLSEPKLRASLLYQQQWDKAQIAACKASTPFSKGLCDLFRVIPKGIEPDFETARKIEALKWAIQDAKSDAYEMHGFVSTKQSKSSADLLKRLKQMRMDWWFDTGECVWPTRPTERLWKNAEGLRTLFPFLPELPAMPEDGRARHAALVRWCEAQTELLTPEQFGACESCSMVEPAHVQDGRAKMTDSSPWEKIRKSGEMLETGHEAIPPVKLKTNALDEADISLLRFLNRTPFIRRKVSDVLPEDGPQDRKAVGKRLKKLAGRTPPLVEFQPDGRGGVVILPAGIEYLSLATPTTPH